MKKYLQKVKSPPEEVATTASRHSLLADVKKVTSFLFRHVCQDCTICMEPLAGPSGYKGPGVGPVSRAESVGRLTQCGHQYHFQCLVAMYNNGNKDGRYE